ncbi:VOC family protein [Metabacillus malikii]|uniref:Lactoylglutathione lyase n=1 Tax=Metabacillus malikii TaxID=1504265 RepID=A0ABT9ZIG4_9BACI|nr:VOC family protein [Metabacillus malikii]MDQ0232075.1 lactoylglutathione lyase [Metabacillus malikii]
MIQTLGQVMLYVDNQEEGAQFWSEKFGFTIIAEEDNGQGMKWIELAPTTDAETTIVLHNKELIAKMDPDLHLGTPSLMFYTKDLDAFYQKLQNNQVTVGEIVEMPSGRVFNFADNENNYFAVTERA